MIAGNANAPRRILFVSWHGLGDNVMLTAALRKYKQGHPEHYVAVAGLRRFGKTLEELLSGLPFIQEVLSVLPDAWNDFADYPTGIQAVLQKAEEIARDRHFDEVKILPTKKQAGYRLHKVFRFADEVGVALESMADLQAELHVDPEADRAARAFLGVLKRPILVLHATAGNQVKTVPPQAVDPILERFPGYTVLEIGRKSTARSIELNESSMELTKAIIQQADRVVAIDSVVMHIAGALQKPLTAIFSHTPIHQAIPLTYNVELMAVENEYTALAVWLKCKDEIQRLYAPRPVAPVVTSPGQPRRQLPELYHDPRCYWAQMVTFRCNGNCPYCILDGRGKHVARAELSGREILEFWNGLEHRPGQRLSLIGGEPLLHPDIAEIVNNLDGYAITITTNCTGPFYQNPDFHQVFKPLESSTLRINTTFHPHALSPEAYLRTIAQWKKSGYLVDQTSYVHHGDIARHTAAIAAVRAAMPLNAAPYLGFYDEHDQFQAPFSPETIEPNERYFDQDGAARICGLSNYDAYRDICGQYEKRQVECNHPFRSLIIDPHGDYYHCHYKLYYDIDPVCNIKTFTPVAAESRTCRHYGFCNWCDVPRVGCCKNTTAQPMVLNKLYDKRDWTRPEIQKLCHTINQFAREHQLEFNSLKWFEYAYALLYSGHRHGCKVLDVGSAKSVWPYFLASLGYQVTTLDLADEDYRKSMGQKFKVATRTWDLQQFCPDLTAGPDGPFDWITNLSVIEHIPNDTQAALNLARYLKIGGIMSISTDFHPRHIEYPDANRTLVSDRPAGSHTDSRVYNPASFMERVIAPLEKAGCGRLGLTDYGNVDLAVPGERAVRGLYTFGIATLRRSAPP